MRRGYGVGFNPSDLGFPPYLVANSMMPSFPTVSIDGMVINANVPNMGGGTLGGSLIARHGYDRFEERLNATNVRGKHTLKFGGVFGVPRQHNDNHINAGGQFSFGRGFTQGPDPLRASPTAGHAFATFLLGAAGGSHNTTRVGMAVLNKYMGAYFQDDIKATPRLTLNFGVRFDYNTPWRERYDHLVNFDSAGTARLPTGVPVQGGLAFVNTAGLPRGAWDKDTNNFSPRFGFAYNLGDASVLRGGYGVFFAQMNGGGYNSNAIPNTGFNCVTTFTSSIDGGLTPYNYLADPFPQGFCQAQGSSAGLLSSLGETIY